MALVNLLGYKSHLKYKVGTVVELFGTPTPFSKWVIKELRYSLKDQYDYTVFEELFCLMKIITEADIKCIF